MNCPVDGTTLQMMERQGIEIDYCPKCRGVWLDRGELDKIIERSAAPPPAQVRSATPSRGERYVDDDDDDDRDEHDREGYGREGYPKRKRKSLLGELFDF
jgi:Zn-finger nucleic acid-binding protein